MILGIDISTSITGYTLLDNAGKIVLVEECDTRKHKKLFDVVKENKKILARLNKDYKIENVFVEENLKSFARMRSSAGTLIKLAKINGLISYFVTHLMGIEPEFISARSARSTVGLKISKKVKEAKMKKMLSEGYSKSYSKSMCTKMLVIEFVADKYGFEYELTHAGNPKPSAFDRADSIIIAKAGFEKVKNDL